MTKVNVLDLAAYIMKRYKAENKEKIDEIKVHKLLYFAQRESLIRYDEPLFDAEFHAWKYGSVLHEIRSVYKCNSKLKNKRVKLDSNQKAVMDYVFEQYSKKIRGV